jgi:hypothetical protein
MPTEEKKPFVPVVTQPGINAPARLRDQWSRAGAFASQLWLANVQLTTVAGAAIVAKTAVAPFERLKVLSYFDTARKRRWRFEILRIFATILLVCPTKLVHSGLILHTKTYCCRSLDKLILWGDHIQLEVAQYGKAYRR